LEDPFSFVLFRGQVEIEGCMSSILSRSFNFLFRVDKQERVKLFFLTACYFFLIGSYTVIKEIKDSIFITVVGEDYLPWAKIAAIFVLIPAIIFYSYLVDKMRRYYLLYFYASFFGIGGLCFAYFLSDPVIGIANTMSDPLRIFGWLFYFFVEGYSPFLISVFWAFANSITNPEAAKKSYGLMVSGSKLGGMITASLAWYLFDCKHLVNMTGVIKHQILLVVASLFLLFIPLFIYLLMKKVPGKFLHGYEAVYKVEKELSKEREREPEKEKVSLFSGLSLILKQPYVLGIFSMIFFYEVINVILSYQRLLLAKGSSSDISDLSCSLFKQIFMVHLIGCLISLLGTNALLRILGERRCLMLVPAVVGVLLFVFMLNNTFGVVGMVYIVLRALNYAISYPVRESLYIPTIKEIKFKSKSWIDSFGSKLAKGFGSGFNIFAKTVFNAHGLAAFMAIHYAFFAVAVSLWFIASYLLGNRFQKAVSRNEVIGA